MGATKKRSRMRTKTTKTLHASRRASTTKIKEEMDSKEVRGDEDDDQYDGEEMRMKVMMITTITTKKF